MNQFELSQLTPKEVAKWVISLGPKFRAAAEVFQDLKIDGRDLQEMEKEDFNGEFGRHLAAMKLWKHIQNAKAKGVLMISKSETPTGESPAKSKQGCTMQKLHSKILQSLRATAMKHEKEILEVSSLEDPEFFLWKKFVVKDALELQKIKAMREILSVNGVEVLRLRGKQFVFYGSKSAVNSALKDLKLKSRLLQTQEFMAHAHGTESSKAPVEVLPFKFAQTKKMLFCRGEDISMVLAILELTGKANDHWTFCFPFESKKHVEQINAIVRESKGKHQKRISTLTETKISLVNMKKESHLLIVGSLKGISKACKEVMKLL